MRRIAPVVSLLLFSNQLQAAAPAPAPAQASAVNRTTAPAGGPPPALTLPTPFRAKLSNGTPVLIVERHTLPLATVVVAWPTGAADEAPGDAGLAGLTADLLDEGAGERGPLELADQLSFLGARLETGASWDSTTASLTTLTRVLDPALALLADVVRRPKLADAELERIRADRMTALLQQRDVAEEVARNVLAATLYGEAQRYGRPLLGTEASLKKARRADVVRWHADRLRPEAATVIVVGDVVPAEIMQRLEVAFRGWTSPPGKRRPATLPNRPSVLPSPQRQVVIVDRPAAAQTDLRLGEPSVERRSAVYFPLVVMNTILGGWFGSRLNMNLREQRGYTYGARSEIAFRRNGGPLMVGAPVKTSVTAPALEQALAEIKRVRDTDVSEVELREAKDMLERAMARTFETPPEVAAALVTQVVEGLPDDYYATYAAHVEAVTMEQVRNAAVSHVDPGKMSIILVGDESAIGPAVRTATGGYQRRDATGALVGKKP